MTVILNSDGTVSNEERPNYIQITDRRGLDERKVWQLSVTQARQFTNSSGKELLGAELRLTNQQLASAQDGGYPETYHPSDVLLVPEKKSILLTASEETGQGTWIYRFGDQESADKSVGLEVPKGSNPEAGIYNTNLIWELSSVPEALEP